MRVLTLYYIKHLYSWFFGKITSENAEQLLSHPKNEQGTFLIRESPSVKGMFKERFKEKERSLTNQRRLVQRCLHLLSSHSIA